jgi:hypothetical protein
MFEEKRNVLLLELVKIIDGEGFPVVRPRTDPRRIIGASLDQCVCFCNSNSNRFVRWATDEQQASSVERPFRTKQATARPAAMSSDGAVVAAKWTPINRFRSFPDTSGGKVARWRQVTPIPKQPSQPQTAQPVTAQRPGLSPIQQRCRGTYSVGILGSR